MAVSCAAKSTGTCPFGCRRRRGKLKTFMLQMAAVTPSAARDDAVGHAHLGRGLRVALISNGCGGERRVPLRRSKEEEWDRTGSWS
jgi:hypothetical protein